MTWKSRILCEGEIIAPKDMRVGDVLLFNGDLYSFVGMFEKRVNKEIWCAFIKDRQTANFKKSDIKGDSDFNEDSTFLYDDWGEIILLRR